MAPFVPSRLPKLVAAAAAVALLYLDRVAPMLLSPQTGWHFAAAARWIWLSFATAGAAKGLLLALALLRASSAPPMAVNASAPDGGKAAPGAAPAAASHQRLGPADSQTALLRVLAFMAFVAASAAAGAKPLSAALGGRLETVRAFKWYVGEEGPPRAAEIITVVALGPLFWALGFALAAATVHVRLAGVAGRRTLLRRLTAAAPVAVLLAAATVETAGDKLAVLLAPKPAYYLEAAQVLWGVLAPALPLPRQPVLHVFGATAAVFGLLATLSPIWIAAAQPAQGLRQAAALRRSGAVRRGAWNLVRLASVPWLAVCGHALWQQRIAASGATPKFRTSDNEFAVLWRQEAASGEFLSVVQGDNNKARFQLLKAGHSILGGRYTMPSYFGNQSIYDIFYVHEGVRLMRSDAKTSLHIGLGVGIAATALARHGIAADVIELQPEVLTLARRFFGCQPEGRVFTCDAGDAVDELLLEAPRPAYDFILHDVFSGGALPSRFFTDAFLVKLRALLAPGGILTVGFFGDPAAAPAKALAERLHTIFGNVRGWAESSPSALRNHVFYASEQPMRLRAPTLDDDLEDGGRAQAYKRFFTSPDPENPIPDDGSRLNPSELDLSWLRSDFEAGTPPPLTDPRLANLIDTPLAIDGGRLEPADVHAANHHWRVMRLIFKGPFWSETY